METFIYGLGAVIIVSLLSLIGLVTLSIKSTQLKKFLIYFVGFSAGAMFGDVFFHLIPELVEEGVYTIQTSVYILSGIIFSFFIEKIIHWHHCHLPYDKKHVHNFAYMNVFGDAMHNFIDGLIIGASFLAGIPVGIATTIAVIMHEIPQEIGDFAVLLHGGFEKKRALLINFYTALTAIAGFVLAYFVGSILESLNTFFLCFAAGNFIYIAGSDLIPELHKDEGDWKKGLIQLLLFIAGIAAMASLLLLE